MRAKTCENVGPLQSENGTIVSDDAGMAEILNNQYASVFSPVLSDEKYENFTSERIDKINVNITMSDIELNSDMLWSAINKMKSHASPGPDGVTGCCLKHGGQYIQDALLDIFTESVEEEYAPDQTRISWICPIWKGDSKMVPANYRPIALTNQIS